MSSGKVAAAVASALALAGCASITSGQTDHVRISSDPPGQACEVYQGGDTIARIVTPQTVAVARTSSGLLVVCGDAREREDSGFNAWTLGNFLFLPVFPIMLVGLGVDWVTGADHGYDDVMVKGAGAPAVAGKGGRG